MTRPELHALVDIVMDAMERLIDKRFILTIGSDSIEFCHVYYISRIYTSKRIDSHNYPTFSDFTQAVQEYIKTLETK